MLFRKIYIINVKKTTNTYLHYLVSLRFEHSIAVCITLTHQFQLHQRIFSPVPKNSNQPQAQTAARHEVRGGAAGPATIRE